MNSKTESYIKRIKENIKTKHLEGELSKRFSFKSFCNNFIPDEEPLEVKESDRCICGHDIIKN